MSHFPCLQKKRVEGLLADALEFDAFVKKHLKSSDANDDGVLNEDECRDATSSMIRDLLNVQETWMPNKKRMDLVFKQCDRNADGVLTEEEFAQFVSKLLQFAAQFLSAKVKRNHQRFESSGFMVNGGGIPLEDTNVARMGSAEDKEQRKTAAEKEPAWTGLGTEPTLKVWRIEKLEVKPWPKDKYGVFYDGDSYIVYCARLVHDVLVHDIFFWIGQHSSQDEYGTAAYKTVELDDFLGGAPMQHREVQKFESAEFKRLFGNTISYLKGGIESGFKSSMDRIGAEFHTLLQVNIV
jgi:hypothetical protein